MARGCDSVESSVGMLQLHLPPVRASWALTCKPLPTAQLRVPLNHPARAGIAQERGLVRVLKLAGHP